MKDACCLSEKIAKFRKIMARKHFRFARIFPRMIASYPQYSFTNCTTMNSIATHCYMHRPENCKFS